MAKVLTERPRVHANNKSQPKGYFRKNDILSEDCPKKESIRKKWFMYGSWPKELTDLIGPLKKYLTSKIGQKWDDIYSEISQNIPVNSMQGHHLRDHVMGMVETNISIVDNEVRDSKGDKIFGYYVDQNGFLRFNPYNRYKWKPKKNNNLKWISDTELFAKINGIWYKVIVKPFIPKLYSSNNCVPQKDLVTGTLCFNRADNFWDYKQVIGVSKRQLNSKEIRRNGLKKN